MALSIEFSISAPISESSPRSVSGWSSRKLSGLTRNTDPTTSANRLPDDALSFFRGGRFDLQTPVTACAGGLLIFDARGKNVFQQRIFLQAAEELPPFGPIHANRHHLGDARR